MTSMTDHEWKAFLLQAREKLADELSAIKTPLRSSLAIGRVQNLRLSLDCVDDGTQAFINSGYELENSRLGALMVAAGFEVVGADPLRNYGGTLPWFGSLREVEQRLAAAQRAEAKAQAAAAEAALTPEQRAQRDAERDMLREEFNKMRVKHIDGQLIAFDADGEPLEELTEVQKRSIAQVEATL
jgi:hypothetical protein